ncbi:hypothetical protein EELLY_v1c00910 [Entomoplasma ellychniae]|uniref:PARCEL domain-containing protein n=1 Tax=Entomoplasma ellychniae TaxID=2114 RepID=A0A8E2QVF9_9MOLU|nr:BspA family leucine-rich repeat surface protein [Entomoplasma ellychniae]PPE04416.1 hypothetical protein EELLY_v1c00910 [Entomoplasma ellychniae]
MKKKILFEIISSLLVTTTIAGSLFIIFNNKQKTIVSEKKHVSKVEDKLQNILDSKTNQEWSIEELNQAIITANIDVAGGITITAGEKSQNFENKRDYHKDTYVFTGNGTSENNYKYNNSISLTHEWNEKNDTTQNISKVEDKLQNILDSKTNQEWSIEELNQAIITANIDVAGGITITAGEKSQNFENKRDYHKDTYVFTGNGTSENNYKYNNSISLTHEWNEKNDTTQNISKVEDKLQNILDSKTNQEWSIEELNQAIITANIDVAGGITITAGEKSQNFENKRDYHKDTYVFTGNGTSENNYKYNNSISLTHEWNEKNDTTQNISKVEDKLQNILDSKTNQEWSIEELNQAIITANIDVAGGITITAGEKSQNFENKRDYHKDTYVFTGNGTSENNYKYNNSISLTHEWNEKNDTTQNISKVEDKLQNILDSKTNQEWSIEELNQAIITANIDVAGGITITAGEKSQNFENKRDYHKDTYVFTGNGTSENNYKYNNSISLTHEWNEKNDTTQNISKVEDKLQNILDSKTNQEWSIEELNQAIITANIDVAGGITITAGEKSQNFENKRDYHKDTYVFTGNGTSENNYKYNNSISLTHEWNEKNDTTQNISKVEDKLQNILDSKTNQEWSIEELNQAIITANIDVAGGIEVAKAELEPLKNETTTVNQIKYTFTGKGEVNNNYKYNGSIELVTSIISGESLADNITVYQDQNGSLLETSEMNFLNLNAVEIYKIGFNSDGSTIQNLKTVKSLPSTLPKEITSLKACFANSSLNSIKGISNWDTSNITSMEETFNSASNFNGDISNWNTSKVTDMSYMFYKAFSFNQDISKWNTGNVENMSLMFASNLETITMPFNQDISKWDTSKVTDMSGMFQNASYFNSDISKWNTSNVTKMNHMFCNAFSFNQDISTKKVNDEKGKKYTAWDTSKVTDMSYMLATISNSELMSFNQDISKWNTSNVTNMKAMLQGASSFNQDISKWDTSKVTDMSYMFCNAFSFNQDISTKKVKDQNGEEYTAWDTSKVTDMTQMFWNDRYPSFNGKEMSFNQDLTNWNVSQVSVYTEFWNDKNIKWDKQPIFTK